jgi:hypothetical protein
MAKKIDTFDKDIVNPEDPRTNPDPITGEPGSHPIGTGAGATGGAASGAAIGGAVGGPIGAAVGAVIGGVAGGLAGKGIAEMINPTEEAAYWRDNFHTRPYATTDTTYDHYEPAYRYGWESRARFENNSFDEVEPTLAQDWSNYRGQSQLGWDKARLATRDAWDRIDAKVGRPRQKTANP